MIIALIAMMTRRQLSLVPGLSLLRRVTMMIVDEPALFVGVIATIPTSVTIDLFQCLLLNP